MKQMALSAACALVFATQASAALEVKLGSTQRGYRENSSEITVSITNNSKNPVSIERWNTPVGGVLDDIFSVTLDGVEVPYTGVHAKWGKPQAADWIELDPFQTLTATVKLGDFYDMYQTGQYQVKFDAHVQVEAINKVAGISHAFGDLTSQPMQMYVSGNGRSEMAAIREAVAAGSQVKAAAQFQNCSSTRKSQLNTAFSSAKAYATNSSSYFTGRTTANVSARYNTWFGAATPERITTAQTHFNNIKNSLNNSQIVFNCSCASQYASTYAYVTPSAPYRITLCGAFWPASNTGTDSKAGTIIHEMSHFNIVASTDDHAYSQSAAKSLAISNPTKALDNADSHEYFSENTPAQN